MIGPIPIDWGGGERWHGGGVSSHVRGLLPRLKKEEINVQYLADNSSEARKLHFPSFPEVVIHGFIRSPQRLVSLGRGGLLRLASRTWKDPVLQLASPARRIRFVAQGFNFNHFLMGTDPDLLHVHHAFHRQYLCQHLLKYDRPIIVTAHSVSALLKSPPAWLEPMIRANCRSASYLIAVSNYVRDKIVAYGADPGKVKVIFNGVDIDIFRPAPPAAARRDLHLPLDNFLFLFSGNLVTLKMVDHLIRALQIVRGQGHSAHLMIVGDGPEEDRLKAMAREMGMAGAVTFAGRRPYTEMASWYQAADVFVLPSAAEGLSMAILEAMASSRPVITTRPGGGSHDAIEPDLHGALVESGDTDDLARAMLTLASNPTLSSEMGKRARQRVEQAFAWDSVVRQTAEVYRHVMEQVR